MEEIIIGIDLGTTNSEVAVLVNGKIEIIEEKGNPIMPSCVGINPSGDLVVGEEARNQHILFPERTIRSIKRKMGTDENILLDESSYSPQEISAMILRKLKERAEKYLGKPVHKAVITVPAQFSDAQRQATRDAGQIAGLEVMRIINEPTAACLSYENDPSKDGKNIIAFDLGGGTFDLSVVRIEGDVVEVIASHGNNRLGGDDIDDMISEYLTNYIYENRKGPVILQTTAVHRLKNIAETAKKHLSDHPHAAIIEENLKTENGDSIFIDTELSRIDFEIMIEPLINKTLLSVHKALSSAGLTSDDIHEIILVGGSTRIPAIKNMIEKKLGKSPRNDIHPDLAVAYGAGVMAARLMGQTGQRVLVDITPYTFGTSALGEVNGKFSEYHFVPLIKSGTPLPVSKSKSFATLYDDQEGVEVRIFQGESKDARDNILIGSFKVTGLAQVQAPNEIIVTMNLNLDGILRVSAIEKETGLNKALTIDDAMAKLSDADIARSREQVSKLFGAPPEIDNEIIIDGPENNTSSIAKYSEISSRIDSYKEKMDDADMDDADELLEKLKTACNMDEKNAIEEVLTEIEDLLFYLETDE